MMFGSRVVDKSTRLFSIKIKGLIYIGVCKVCGKDVKQLRKGMCERHYRQCTRYKGILRTKYDLNEIVMYKDYAEIILYDKKCNEVSRSKIDLEDIDKVKNIKWGLNNEGYCKNNKIGMLHRFLMNCPDDMVVDHINHDKLDNRKSNLRTCSRQENNLNINVRSNNTSSVTGVSWDKKSHKWRAYIFLNRKQLESKFFDDFNDAVRFRKNLEIKYFGEFRNVN